MQISKPNSYGVVKISMSKCNFRFYYMSDWFSGGGSWHFLSRQSKDSFQGAGCDHVLPRFPNLHVLWGDRLHPIHESYDQRHARSSGQQDHHHDLLVHWAWVKSTFRIVCVTDSLWLTTVHFHVTLKWCLQGSSQSFCSFSTYRMYI